MTILSRLTKLATLPTAVLVLGAAPVQADPARNAILQTFAVEAKAADAQFTGFSADRGKAFWFARHASGKPDTPACTSCHSQDPSSAGETRAGKRIEPMAVSKNPKRFTDAGEVEKWFGRNCDSVVGRPCTPLEKGDVIQFLSSQ